VIIDTFNHASLKIGPARQFFVQHPAGPCITPNSMAEPGSGTVAPWRYV
jgi:hypothetical protein